jgi:hypothetical protein
MRASASGVSPMGAIPTGSSPAFQQAADSAKSADARSTGSRERKRCLDLRARVVLAESGVRFFGTRSTTLHRFDGPDGEGRYGFRLRTVDVPWLRRLLLSGFVDKAEFPVRDVGSVKDDVGDLARLVVFSMLYGRFRSSTMARAVDSDVIRRWNRLHPHQALDAQNAVSPAELRGALESRADAIRELKREIAIPALRTVSIDEKRSAEDKKRLAHFAQDLLSNLDPLVFFVLLGSPPEARIAMEQDIGKELLSALDKVDLADYLSLMVLELMSAAERSTLIALVGSEVPQSELRAQLEDPRKRSELLSKLPNGLASAMVWSLARRWSLGRWRYRLRLGLYDGSSSYEDSKRLFEERGRLSVSDKSLKEFYENGTGPYGDDGLGWYYLSFLGEACENMGVGFEASVRERTGSGTAAVNLVFVF